MTDEIFLLLPEGNEVSAVIDDDLFTEVTEHGEIYTSYRVVRFTHVASDHPDGWTHVANVVRVHERRIGVALLKISDRIIRDVKVTLSTTEL